MSESELRSWVNTELALILGSEVDGALIEYLFSLSSQEELREYLSDIIPNQGTAVVQGFLEQFLAKQSAISENPVTDYLVHTFTSHSPPPQPDTLLQMPLIQAPPKVPKSQTAAPVEEPSDAPKLYIKPSQSDIVYMPERKHINIVKSAGAAKNPRNNHSEEDASSKKKSGQKYVPFTSSEGSRISTRLPGRHSCQCIGQKHTLVNNCLECGRVVCSQEGAGPCLFCGVLVVSPQDQETIRKGGRKAAAKIDTIMKKFQIDNVDEIRGHKDTSSTLNKAVAYKDRLLEYDKTCQQRTKVFDDESDYYRTTKWMSPEEAARAKQVEETQHKLKHPSRRGAVNVTLDFAGRQAIEGKTSQMSQQDAQAFIEGNMNETGVEPSDDPLPPNTDSLAHPNIPFTPKFMQTERNYHYNPESKDISRENVSSYRIQDSHLAELSDSGSCLSMHQPWASLLVAGVKRLEGRSWYTSHRGRLWIASTPKAPTEQDISDVEAFYRHLYGQVDFPSSYPVGSLLGCVNLKDCVLQEDYIALGYVDEIDSPYGFVCEDPHVLKINVPVRGMHKIWKLEGHKHRMCKRFLSPSMPIY